VGSYAKTPLPDGETKAIPKLLKVSQRPQEMRYRAGEAVVRAIMGAIGEEIGKNRPLCADCAIPSLISIAASVPAQPERSAVRRWHCRTREKPLC
jgi:hypothetical protein